MFSFEKERNLSFFFQRHYYSIVWCYLDQSLTERHWVASSLLLGQCCHEYSCMDLIWSECRCVCRRELVFLHCVELSMLMAPWQTAAHLLHVQYCVNCRCSVTGWALCGHRSLYSSEILGPQKNFRLCPELTPTFWFLLTSALSLRLDCLSHTLPLANSSSHQPKCQLLKEDFLVLPKWYCFPLLLIL